MPSSPAAQVRRKKYKIHIVEQPQSTTDDDAVDVETAKLVQNLKERLNTFDSDLEKVRAAALKIHQDLNNDNR